MNMDTIRKNDVPPYQTSTKMMAALADFFRKQEPTTWDFIQTLGGNPRIYEVAYGHDDHVSFIVDSGWGDKNKRAIVAWLEDARPQDELDGLFPHSRFHVDSLITDGGDVIVWRA